MRKQLNVVQGEDHLLDLTDVDLHSSVQYIALCNPRDKVHEVFDLEEIDLYGGDIILAKT